MVAARIAEAIMANAAAAAAEGEDELAETVSRLVLRVTMQREHAGGSRQPHGGGPLTAQELQELSFYCTAQDCAVQAAYYQQQCGGKQHGQFCQRRRRSPRGAD